MISDFYTSTISRETKAKVSDGAGGFVDAWTEDSTFSARIYQLKANEIILNEARQPVETHRGITDDSSTVAYVDRWVTDGITYEIERINAVKNKTALHHYEVGLRLVG